jgi:hypothetical protein
MNNQECTTITTHPFKHLRWTAAQTFVVATLALGGMSGLRNDVEAQDGRALPQTKPFLIQI